jgi:hypothetical protein
VLRERYFAKVLFKIIAKEQRIALSTFGAIQRPASGGSSIVAFSI